MDGLGPLGPWCGAPWISGPGQIFISTVFLWILSAFGRVVVGGPPPLGSESMCVKPRLYFVSTSIPSPLPNKEFAAASTTFNVGVQKQVRVLQNRIFSTDIFSTDILCFVFPD